MKKTLSILGIALSAAVLISTHDVTPQADIPISIEKPGAAVQVADIPISSEEPDAVIIRGLADISTVPGLENVIIRGVADPAINSVIIRGINADSNSVIIRGLADASTAPGLEGVIIRGIANPNDHSAVIIRGIAEGVIIRG
ncbi:MAG TPA: hypothetical protein VFV52_02655 [Bacilli bacterium]|nr:hypothetical protein [Bacilli bacterium]